MFSVRFTLALLLILMIPFILRTLSYRLEPYPALLFPGGESMVSVPLDSAIYNYSFSELHGYKKGVGWQIIDEEEFIKPIPQHYLSAILKHNIDIFENSEPLNKGGSDSTETALNPNIPGLFSYLLRNQERKWSENDKRKSTDWFKNKLIVQGFEPDKIKLVKIKILSYPNDEKFEKVIIDEEIVSISRALK